MAFTPQQLNLSGLEQQNGLPSGLLAAVMQQESGGNAQAVSPAGAQGLFQFMPQTAKAYGINPNDPQQAAIGAARMYGDLNKQYAGDVPSMLAAYNWGSGNLAKNGLANAPQETKNYIANVQANMQPKPQQMAQADTGNATDASIDNLTPEQAKAQLAAMGLDADGNPLNSSVDNMTPEQAKAELAKHGLDENGNPDPYTIQPIQIAPEKPQSDQGTGWGRTALEQFNQGPIPGFGDEISAGLGAVGAKLYDKTIGDNATDGQSIGDLYNQSWQVAQGRLANQRSDHPTLSLLANLLGGVTGAIAGGGIAKAAAPETAGALGAYAKANPYIAGAGVGGVSGALYGAGTGGTDETPRGANALLGLATGIPLGVVGTAVGRNVISPAVNALADTQVGRALGMGAQEAAPAAEGAIDGARPDIPMTAPESNAPSRLSADTPNAQSASLGLAKNSGDIFSKTKGEALQDVEAQRLQNNAAAGLANPAAKKAVTAINMIHNREYHEFMDQVAGGQLDKETDPVDLISKVASTIRTNADAAQTGVRSAYDLADQGRGVQIKAQDIQKGLFKTTADMLEKGGLTDTQGNPDLSNMPKFNQVLKKLAGFSDVSEGAPTAAKLSQLERMRTLATNYANDEMGTNQGRLLSKFVNNYDDFMEKTAANAVDVGDTKAINAFRDAVGKRAEYGRLFERNKMVNEFVTGKTSLDDMVSKLGAIGSIKSKREMANTLDAILTASGDQKEAVTNDLRQAFTQNMFKNSTMGYEEGNGSVMRLSPGKMKAQLENMFVNQKEFANKLYGPDSAAYARKAINELKLISSVQPHVANPSGSGELSGRLKLMTKSLATPIGHLSYGLFEPEKIGAMLEARGERNELAKSLGDFMVGKNLQPKSAIWSAVGPAASTAAFGSFVAPHEAPQFEEKPSSSLMNTANKFDKKVTNK